MGRDAALAVPGLLKGQAAQDMIDQGAHLAHAPTGPRPDLRRHEIKDGNAVGMRPPGQPPMKTRVIDQHHSVGLLQAEIAVGFEQQREKLVGALQHTQHPHDR